MSAPLKMLVKHVIERRRLYFDYSCWLAETETLTDFQSEVVPYTVDAPLTVDTAYPDASNKKLMLFVGDGVANTNYRVSVTVRTSAGQVKRDDIGLRVVP